MTGYSYEYDYTGSTATGIMGISTKAAGGIIKGRLVIEPVDENTINLAVIIILIQLVVQCNIVSIDVFISWWKPAANSSTKTLWTCGKRMSCPAEKCPSAIKCTWRNPCKLKLSPERYYLDKDLNYRAEMIIFLIFFWLIEGWKRRHR